MIRGDFLNEEQKQIKQKIMEDLMNALFGNMEFNIDKFDHQSAMDIIFSCSVMFAREVLIRFIIGTGDLKMTESLMMQYQAAVGMSVQKELEEHVKNEGGTH